jgi:hypothetical protein
MITICIILPKLILSVNFRWKKLTIHPAGNKKRRKQKTQQTRQNLSLSSLKPKNSSPLPLIILFQFQVFSSDITN